MPARLYSWDDWFSKDVFTIRQRRDYHCSTSSMVQQVRNAASARGLLVEIQDLGHSILVKVHRPALVR